MSILHNYIVLADFVHQDEPDDGLLSPWVRLDDKMGSQRMEGRIWALVARDDVEVVAELVRAHRWNSPNAVMLLAKCDDDEVWSAVDWRGMGLSAS